jgi:hypothetical protein
VLTVSGNSTLTVDTTVASASSSASQLELWYALTESGLESSVRAGENRGKTLRHDHVVRALSGPHALQRGPLQIELPDQMVRAQTRLVALVQDQDTGSYVQAVSLALAECPGA